MEPVARYTRADGDEQTAASDDGPVIELTADFILTDDLEFPCDLRIVPARGDGAVRLRTTLPEGALDGLCDALLDAQYGIRRAPSRGDGHSLFYVRPPDGPVPANVVLTVGGTVEVADGIDGGWPRIEARRVRFGRRCRWRGDVSATHDVRLGPETVLHGDVDAAGELVLTAGVRLEGQLRAGTVRFDGDAPFVGQAVTTEPAAPWPTPSHAAGTAVLDVQSEPDEEAQGVPQTADEEEATPAAAPFPGPFRFDIHVTPDPTAVPRVLRPHLTEDGTMTVEVLRVADGKADLLLHPDTAGQFRLSATVEELASDAAIGRMLTIHERMAKFRFTLRPQELVFQASVESIRWLITTFGKAVSLQSRLGRLKWMRFEIAQNLDDA